MAAAPSRRPQLYLRRGWFAGSARPLTHRPAQGVGEPPRTPVSQLSREPRHTIPIPDNKIASVSCPSSSLAAGANMTCTGSYTTTAADLNAGSVTNTATATGTPTSGSLPPATAQATITANVQPAWTLSKTP